MSYNGIGLQTAKGSATNGYIQKNYTKSVKTNYQRRLNNKQNNEKRDRIIETVQDKELLEHEKKRKLEVKVSEYRDKLEDDGELNDDEIDEKCKEYRESLLNQGKKRDRTKQTIERKKQEEHIEKTEDLDY